MPANPSLYRDLSVPFPDLASAQAALAEFWKELGALREKHRIRDLYVILGVPAVTPEGETVIGTRSMYGSQAMALAMVAEAYGGEKAEHDEMLASLLAKRSRKKDK